MSVAPDIIAPVTNNWGIDRDELRDIVQNYVKRVEYEELPIIEKHGGTKGICQKLDTDHEKGLSDEQIAKETDSRVSVFGSNRLPARARTPFWVLMWDAAGDFTLRILLVCGLVSIILGVTTGEHPEIEWIEGFAIWVAVIVVVLVTASNDYAKEKQFEKLNAVKDDKYVTVIRSGTKQSISVGNLLVGDLLFLEAGDEIPADCFVVNANELKADESSLTGETEQIGKNRTEVCNASIEGKKKKIEESTGKKHLVIESPVLLSGTTVTSGSCEALVIAVGKASQMGSLYDILSTEPEITPLQLKLENIARDIGKCGLIASGLTLFALVVSYWIVYSQTETHPTSSEIVRSHISFITIAITIIAVAVPEGLPLAVTISLAYSINKMLKDNNWVRKLQACETMGSANEICSDKTGTLTKNKMTVQAFFSCSYGMIEWNGNLPHEENKFIDIDLEGKLPSEEKREEEKREEERKVAGRKTGEEEKGDEGKDGILPRLLDEAMIRPFMECLCINSTGYLEIEEKVILNDRNERINEIKHVGSPTECALLQFLHLQGIDVEKIRADAHNSVLKKVSFTSDRKMMTTIITHPTNPALLRVLCKGAAEKVLSLCTHRANKQGEIVSMPPSDKSRIERLVIQKFAGDALRTICIAYKDFDPSTLPDWNSSAPDENNTLPIEKNLICIGVTGIRDPVRDEVPYSVLQCQRAGINVRMVTGDNIETAKQIALRCNIIKGDRNLVLLGKDFYKLVGGVICSNCSTETCECPRDKAQQKTLEKANNRSYKIREDILGNVSKFREIKDRLAVIARSQPSDKYALVTGLKNENAIVAVTGDGVNDTLALKKADVGFAMGITGKEIAKQASDIVLLDDNFKSIIKAIIWGRNIYDNIQKFLQFQLTVNIVAVVVSFISSLLLRGTPIYAIQLLWINLIMDSLASLALATEAPTESLLEEKPHSRDEYLISKTLWRNILSHSLYQIIVIYLIIFLGDRFLYEDDTFYNHVNRNIAQADRDEIMNVVLPKLYPDRDPSSLTFKNAFYSPFGNGEEYIISGRDNVIFSPRAAYSMLIGLIGPSKMYSIVFNTFVFMQVFNLINSRKLRSERNVFGNITKNSNWIAIFLFIIGLQVILVQFGGLAFKVCVVGLSAFQWMFCVLVGVSVLVVHQIIVCIPMGIFPNSGIKEVNPMESQPTVSQILRGRTTSSQFIRRAASNVNRNNTDLTCANIINQYNNLLHKSEPNTLQTQPSNVPYGRSNTFTNGASYNPLPSVKQPMDMLHSMNSWIRNIGFPFCKRSSKTSQYSNELNEPFLLA